MTTFSQLVDTLSIESLRPDMKTMIAGFANQTIRELHYEKMTGAAIGFARNLLELSVVANVDEAFSWTLPRQNLFMRMEAVRYPDMRKYARLRSPSTTHAFVGTVDWAYFYYRAGNYMVFSGYGGIGSQIDLAWFEYLRKLSYFAPSANPCSWNDDTQAYTYIAGYNVDDTTRAQAQLLATNWMLETHEEIVMQGTRAKLYMRLGDLDRAKLAFSLFENLRPGLTSAETYDTIVSYYK